MLYAATQTRERVCVSTTTSSRISSSCSLDDGDDVVLDDGLTCSMGAYTPNGIASASTSDDAQDAPPHSHRGRGEAACGDERNATWLLSVQTSLPSTNNSTNNSNSSNSDDADDDNEPSAVVALRQEDYIPYDYDAEMDDDDDVDVDVDDGGSGAVGRAGFVHHVALRGDVYADMFAACTAAEPFSTPWLRAQSYRNHCHHATVRERWVARQLQRTVLGEEASVYAVEALIAEAAHRDLRRLRATHAHGVVGAGSGLGARASTACTAAAGATVEAEAEGEAVGCADYVAYARRQWCVLLRRVRAMMGDGSALCAREVMSSLSMLNLFSDDARMLVRELNVTAIEEQRRQRRMRAEELLATLTAQRRLFLLPTLHAYEEVAPRRVLVAPLASADATPPLTTQAHDDNNNNNDVDDDDDDDEQCRLLLPRSCAHARATAVVAATTYKRGDDDGDNDDDDDVASEEAGPSTAFSDYHTDATTSPLSSASVCSDDGSGSYAAGAAATAAAAAAATMTMTMAARARTTASSSVQSSRCVSATSSPSRRGDDDDDDDDDAMRDEVVCGSTGSGDGAHASFLTPVLLHSCATFFS